MWTAFWSTSPHERAWRDALQGITDPARFTTEIYQAHVAGKPRLSGARAVLEQLGVPDAGRQALLYAERKQRRLEELIDAGEFTAFPDALRFVQAVGALGLRLAAASSSKNANADDAIDPRRSPGRPCSMFSPPTSAVAICARASLIRRYSCLLPRSWA